MEYNPMTHICQNGVANPARCNGVQYSPLEQSCCVSAIYSLANQRCQGNVVETKCGIGNNYHNPETQFCNGNEVLNKCGGEEYDSASQMCQGNVILTKCGTGNIYHNPAMEQCCGNSKYTIETQFCSANTIYSKCNNSEYNPATQFCQNGTNEILSLCGGEEYAITEQCCADSKYAIATQFCQAVTNVVKNFCGTATYAANQRCGANNVIEMAHCGGEEYAVTEQCCVDSKYAIATQFCQGGTTVKPLCGGRTFTTAEFCQGTTVKPLCDGQTYTSSQFCQSGTDAVLSLCGTQTYTATQFCSGNQVYNLCGGEEYNPANQTCQSNVVVTRCGTGNTYHNPATEQCCGNSKFTAATEFCQSTNVVKPLCDGKTYTSSQFCQSGTYDVLSLCGTQTYIATQFCSGNQVYNLCGGGEYNPANQTCQSNIVVTRCGTGSTYHNPATEQCCGNSKFTIATQFCSGNQVYNLCGGEEYNPANQTCQSYVILTRCGTGNAYHNPATEQCCGNSKFTTATEFCQSTNVVKLLCGDQIYTSSQFCQSGTDAVLSLCGTQTYTTYQRCIEGIVETSCGIYWYNPAVEYCSHDTKKIYGSVTLDNQTYKTAEIGNQVWMAENLNYNVNNSVCYDNDNNNCNKYGRLYNWVTAMNLSANCGEDFCSNQISQKHKGICPSGWHIPNASDWDILMKYVQENNGSTYTSTGNASIAGKYLKAASGWNNDKGQNGNGEDKYGFMALPGGIGGGGFFGGSDVGNVGNWWSTPEGVNGFNAYHRHMNYSNESASWSVTGKSYLRSVRCVKD
jgi:uncharacterized protein (TIGR02145 family)